MFHGSIVALVTPFKIDGAIDWESLSRLIEFHLEEGTQAISVIGSTGEAGTLTVEEKQKIIRYTVMHVKNRVPVIAGTGENSTKHTIELTKIALEAGADASLMMTPAYIKPTQEGLYLHYKMIAETVPIPIILYNVPGRTACDMLPDTIARLAEISNIVAVKEATGQVKRSEEILAKCGDKVDVYGGEDVIGMEVMLAGGKGVISVTNNIAPQLMRKMCDAALSRDSTLANFYNDKLAALHKNLFIETNPIPVKWALHQMGLIEGGIRLPLTPLSKIYHESVRAAMKEAEINE